MPRTASSRRRRRREPSQARSTAMVAAIVEAAARVLAQRGYAGATTNHIARAAGASVGSVYEYFADKDAIFAKLAHGHLDAAEDAFSQRFASLEAGAPLEGIVATLVDAMIQLHAAQPEVHRRLALEVPLGPAVQERVRRLEARAAAALRALLDGHPEVGADLDLAVPLALETVDALTHRWFADRSSTLTPAVASRELTRLLVGYLRG